MWFACYTMEEIGEAVGVHKDTVSEVCRNIADLQKSDKSARLAAEFGEAEFETPARNAWRPRRPPSEKIAWRSQRSTSYRKNHASLEVTSAPKEKAPRRALAA